MSINAAASDNGNAGISQLRSLHAAAADRGPVPSTDAKHCWVCFANEDDDYSAQWVSPCKCRGTAKWVHKSCLQRWIDEKQQGNSTVEVACPQCNSVYIIVYPKCGLFVRILDFLDRIICKACPFLAGGILVGSIYWTAVTYGAVTIMQVLGHKEGLNVMEKADPLIMLIGLPAIPMMLMLGRLIRWEDAVLKFWRKHSTKLPLLNLIFPNTDGQYLPRTPAAAYASNSDPISFTRTICGGLILPTIATIFGKLLFQRINSNFQRSIIGGISFVGLKGIFKIYYKQQQYLRQAHRQIKNFDQNQPPANPATRPLYQNILGSSPHNPHGLVPGGAAVAAAAAATSSYGAMNVNRRMPPRHQEPQSTVAAAAANNMRAVNAPSSYLISDNSHVSFLSQDAGAGGEFSSPSGANASMQNESSFFSANQSASEQMGVSLAQLSASASSPQQAQQGPSAQQASQQRYQLIRASSGSLLENDAYNSSSSSSSSASSPPSNSGLDRS